MPKRILLTAFAITALALAACDNAYNPNYLYGTPLPTATAASPTPNPQASTAIVTVYASSAPLPNWSVNLMTDVNGNAGTLLRTQTTDSTGTTTFSNLTPATNYCFQTTYTPPGGLAQTQSLCGFLWFNGQTFNFP